MNSNIHHQTVIRESSTGHQKIIKQYSNSHQEAIKKRSTDGEKGKTSLRLEKKLVELLTSIPRF